MKNTWYWLKHYRPGRLGQNTMLGAAGLGARAVIQAAYLLIVSRWLGSEGYGLFAGSVALATLAMPLANWGSALLLTQHIARDRNSSRGMWATALVQTGVVGGLLTIGILIASSLLHERLPLGSLLILAISELLLLPVSHAASSHCSALERGGAAALSVCLVPLGRTVTILATFATGLTASPELAAMAHFSGTVVGIAAVITLIAWVDGLPAWQARLPLPSALRQGTSHAISNIASTSYQEIDKVLMLQLLGAAAVGSYTVSFRVASIFVLPVSALISASLPRLIARAGSVDSARTYRAVLITGIGYGVLAGIGILVAAPWIPMVFGSDYIPSTTYLYLLAPWPILYALRHCLSIYLIANQCQIARTYADILGLGTVTLTNLLLLPRLGADGAAIALIGSEALLAMAVALMIKIYPSKKYTRRNKDE
ncbi:lipopolysaccharide biosynthesis protein [Comamonas sp. J-3]|uniref:lipopolysaccharide biosynthesis protein n=1 Tax=Comamonas trifloxystrobinivorans TaxID=3350256 RepID=UPI00372C727D